MKNILPLLMCCMCLQFLSTSCTDDLSAVNAAIELTPEEQAKAFLHNRANKILFGAVTVDHATNHVRGILIDKTATLRSVDVENASFLNFNDSRISDRNLDKLYELSNPLESLSLVETADYLKVANTLNLNPVIGEINKDSESSKVYINYRRNLNSNAHSNGGCGGGSSYSTASQPVVYNQTVIRATGRINQINPVEKAVSDLMFWLQGLEESIDD